MILKGFYAVVPLEDLRWSHSAVLHSSVSVQPVVPRDSHLGVTNSKTGLTLNSSLFILFSIVSCFLYPYARFVYESVVGYVMGNNVFS